MNKVPYITELFTVDALQKIQDAFSTMIGMAALITDENGHAITEPSNFTDYCWKYTRQAKLGALRCEQCDKYGSLMAHDTGKPTFYTCHAGLIDFAAPIVANGTIIGAVIGGQVLTRPLHKALVKETAEATGINFEEYWEAAQKIKIVSQKRIGRAMEFLYTISSILSNMSLDRYKALNAAEETRKASLEIEKAAQMKTDFLANMSHEIRTPMNAIIGMAEMALREDIPDEARSYINQIKSSGRSLLTIINDILDFSKIESGKMDIVPIEYDSMSMFNDVSNIIMTRLIDKDVYFDLDITPHLPSMLYGDNIRIRQVLINLANNAVKFTNYGFVCIKVDFEWIDSDNILLKISVIDTGIGIKKEDLSKIFESFQQVDSKRNRNVEGTGLGLAITRRLLSLMGGQLSVTSEYGEGSTFTFSLPQKVVVKDSAIVVKSTKNKFAVGLFTRKHLINSFLRDSKRLGIAVKNIDRNVNLEDMLAHIKEKHGADTEVFLFVGEKLLEDPSIKTFIEAHPEVTSSYITDFAVEAHLNLPNLRIVKKPLSCLNLTRIYNKEKISLGNTIEHDGRADFTAPTASVLIVDDNTVNLTVAEGLLEPLKLKVFTATSGAEALRKIKRHKFDLILMDHMMPDMDGVETTQNIRANFPSYKNTPIIALTANAIEKAKKLFLSSGMNDIIVKPIEIRILMTKMRQWLPKAKIHKVTHEEEMAEGVSAQPAQKSAPMFDKAVVDLDIEAAVKLLGSEKVFQKILKEYYRLIPTKAASIQNHFDKADWANYTIEVHALKSSSKQIGAMQLSDMAAALEKAGKEGDIDYIKANSAAALEKYRSYETVLAPYCKEQQEEQGQKPPCDSKTLKDAFKEIRHAATELDMGMLEAACKKIAGYSYPPNQAELLERLTAACGELDMDACAEIVDEWDALVV